MRVSHPTGKQVSRARPINCRDRQRGGGFGSSEFWPDRLPSSHCPTESVSASASVSVALEAPPSGCPPGCPTTAGVASRGAWSCGGALAPAAPSLTPPAARARRLSTDPRAALELAFLFKSQKGGLLD